MDRPRPRLCIVGAKGRMGRVLCGLAAGAGFDLAAEVDQGDDLTAGVRAADVAVEFGFHEVSPVTVRAAVAAGKPLVIGTTGHTCAEREAIQAGAAGIPLVWAANYSVGVNALFWLAGATARALGEGFDIEVVEMHHNLKKDAPSGTARRLAEILCAARGLDYARDVRHGREGITGERPRGEIGMHALRGGDVVGDHTVVFATGGERVELAHRASSRETFARGALRAAQWALRQRPGLYDMQDVLGLK